MPRKPVRKAVRRAFLGKGGRKEIGRRSTIRNERRRSRHRSNKR